MRMPRTISTASATLCIVALCTILHAAPPSQSAAIGKSPQPAATRFAASQTPAATQPRPVPPIEKVRPGVRCPVTADTQVSFYKSAAENERFWNYGKASRLKLKGFEEYVLLKFDIAKCRGMTVRRATLYLPKTDQCAPAVIAPSTVSADWTEGTGPGHPNSIDQASRSTGGATALRAVHPDKTWAGPGSDLKWVVFGEGGSTYDARPAGLARDGKTDYVTVDLPLDVAQGLLVEGDSYGLCFTEEKGQRAFNKVYIDPPNPNHFILARESGKAAFLIIEGDKTDRTPPDPISDTQATPGPEAGDIVLSWTCTADDGHQGAKALGYRVYLSTKPLTAATLTDKTLLPRCQTYRPKDPGSRQLFPIYDLAPAALYHFAVVAYDEAGNASAPAFFDGTTRQARAFALQPHEDAPATGDPGLHGPLQVWACPSNTKINPVTGNNLDEVNYTKEEHRADYRAGNAVWDGAKHRVALFTGRNDFAGFQLALQNTVKEPLTDITVALKGIWQDSGLAFRSVEAAKVDLFWQWSCKDKAGTYYPDALLPLEGPLAIPNPANKIPGQTVQPLYIDLYVPHNTVPGSYVVVLQIEAPNVPPFVVPIDLTVWDFCLPDTLSFLPNMYSYNMPRFLGPDEWAGALDMYRLAHKNRLNLKIIPHSHEGQFTNPFLAMEATGQGKDRRIASLKTFDEHYGPLLDGSAFANMPRRSVPLADVTLPVFENFPCTLAGGFTFDPYGTHLDIRQDFSQDYADGFVAVCRQLADHFRAKGYVKTTFEVIFRSKYQYAPTKTFWLLDEPMFRDDYLALNYFAHLTRLGFADMPNVRLRTDCSRVEEAHGLLNEVDVFDGTMSNLREYSRPMKDMLASYTPKPDGRPRTLWVYGRTNRVNASNVANRAWSIDAWLFGADSVVPWLAFGPDEAFDKADSADQAVFYPGQRFDHNGVFGSLRMKAFRDGQQDVECLILLARQLGATRKEIATLLRPICPLQGDFAAERPEAADTISYARLTPDDLVRLRRTLGYNLHLLARRATTPPASAPSPNPASSPASRCAQLAQTCLVAPLVADPSAPQTVTYPAIRSDASCGVRRWATGRSSPR